MESASITRSFCPSYMQSVKDSVGHCLGDAVWRGHGLAVGAPKASCGVVSDGVSVPMCGFIHW